MEPRELISSYFLSFVLGVGYTTGVLLLIKDYTLEVYTSSRWSTSIIAMLKRAVISANPPSGPRAFQEKINSGLVSTGVSEVQFTRRSYVRLGPFHEAQ